MSTGSMPSHVRDSFSNDGETSVPPFGTSRLHTKSHIDVDQDDTPSTNVTMKQGQPVVAHNKDRNGVSCTHDESTRRRALSSCDTKVKSVYADSLSLGQLQHGRWTQQEHNAFLDGLKQFGRKWKKIAKCIPTRTSSQIRSHAQKYFGKLHREIEYLHLPPAPVLVPRGNDSYHQLSPAVRHNIERILTNPTDFHREVEETVLQLLERQQQLQRSLNIVKSPQRPMTQLHHQTVVPKSAPSVNMTAGQTHSPAAIGGFLSEEDSLEQTAGVEHNNHSSSSSSAGTPTATMDNNELIALHVLGGTLPRGERRTVSFGSEASS